MRFQEILNQALAENFTCLTQKLANPPLKSGSSFPNRDPLLKKAKNSSFVTVDPLDDEDDDDMDDFEEVDHVNLGPLVGTSGHHGIGVAPLSSSSRIHSAQ